MVNKRAQGKCQRCIGICFLAIPYVVLLLPHCPKAHRGLTSTCVQGNNPWKILRLPRPDPSGSKSLMLADVRRAFRKVARKKHPDTGGSEEQFRLLVWAYNHIIENGANAGLAPDKHENMPSWAGGKVWSSDGFIEDR